MEQHDHLDVRQAVAVEMSAQTVRAGLDPGQGVRLGTVAWIPQNIDVILPAGRGFGRTVRCLSYSPDGALLVGSSNRRDPLPSNDIRIWDAQSGELKHIIGPDTPGAHKHWVECFAFTPDGKTLATCSHDQTAKLWDTSTWQLRATLKGHHEVIYLKTS